MSGGKVSLLEMEASDMMDVLHFLYEEDFTVTSEDQARSRSNLRDNMYRDLYGVKYEFKLRDKNNASGTNITDVQHVSDADPLGDVKPFDPRKQDDPFSSPRKSKVKFVDASQIKAKDTLAPGLDAPLG